jgi:predicted small secreted protein
MNNSFKRLALFFMAVGFLGLFTTGCQTTKGFGQDVEKLGDKIEEKAEEKGAN